MAFINSSAPKQREKVILEVIDRQDGQPDVTHKYLVNRLTRGEAVRISVQMRNDDGKMGAEMMGKLFDTAQPVEGDKSIYDILEQFDDETLESFISYVIRIATEDRNTLISEGIDFA